MSVTLSLFAGAGAQFFTNNGVPLSGGKIYTYQAGTTTPLATYTTNSESAFHTNPIILDAAGRVPSGGEIWLQLGVGYKFVLMTSTDVLIATYDNIPSSAQPPAANDADSIMYEQGYIVTAGSFVAGKIYRIASVGTTNFTLIGAVNNTVGTHFIATGAGTGTGTAELSQTVETKLRQTVSVIDFGADPTGATNSSVAVQAAVNSVVTLGGSIVFPPGKYLFTSQVTIDRTYAVSGSNFVGERNLIISGYGAEIRTTGAITAFDVKGGWSPNHNCLIEGFTIYHRGNTQALGGIRMIGAGLVTCREVSVAVSSSLPAGYGAFILENSNPADPDTGCFWCLIDQCTIRPWAGADGYCDYGVKAVGAANALTLRNNTFGGSDIHVILAPHTGETYSPNSVNIDGNFFEGPTSSRGIRLFSTAPLYHVSGTRITNNRFEAILTAVLIEGTPSAVQLPTYMSGNYADTSVTNYVVNTSGVPIVMLDFDLVGAPMGPAKMQNQQGVIIENDNGSYNALTLKIPNLTKGLELRRQSGNVFLGTLAYSNAAGGNGMQLAGSYTPDYRPLTIKGCQGIASRDTSANNLAGAVTFSASTSVAVTLPNAEPDANYLIFFDNPANQTLWVTSKATTGFTINSSASNSTTVGWLLIRHL